LNHSHHLSLADIMTSWHALHLSHQPVELLKPLARDDDRMHTPKRLRQILRLSRRRVLKQAHGTPVNSSSLQSTGLSAVICSKPTSTRVYTRPSKSKNKSVFRVPWSMRARCEGATPSQSIRNVCTNLIHATEGESARQAGTQVVKLLQGSTLCIDGFRHD
jgi:hypothetical protein